MTSTNENTSENKSFELSGKVAKPGHFPMKDDATFGEYLQLAGGLTLDPKNAKVTISRARDGRTETVSYHFEPMDRLPTPQAGDIVRLEEEVAVEMDTYPKPKRLRNLNPILLRNPQAQAQLIDSPRDVYTEEHLHIVQSMQQYSREPGVKRMFNQVASYITATKTKVIGIMSPTACDQKQVVTAALALGFKDYLDARVLVLGLDKKSKLLSSLQVSKEAQQQATGNSDIRSQVSSVNGLDVVFAEHLRQVCDTNLDFYVHAIIQELRAEYDLILVDLPWFMDKSAPVDAIIAGSQTDSCLVVLESNAQGPNEIAKFKRELERHRISCLGTVAV